MTVESRIATDRSGYPAGSDWTAIHIFYASNPNPLLAQCVAPLVQDLRNRGLLRRYFFIRYWQEGPHVRLRLLPTRPEDTAEACRIAEAAVDRFIAHRPALFDLDNGEVDGYHKDMFVFEYGEDEWDRTYGARGMPVQPNNSHAHFPYEPEYDRYGGPAGVDLAEWHFEKSSDMVLRLVDSTNLHVRTVMFGLSAQLALVMGFTFRPTPGALARFLNYYTEFWLTAYPSDQVDQAGQFEKGYATVADVLGERVTEISRATLGGETDRLASFIKDWGEHCLDLRNRVAELSVRGDLTFRSREDPGLVPSGPVRREPITDPDIALGILLSGYVHMTNNRLGVGIHDEAYLAYVLRRSVMDVHGVTMDELGIDL